MISRISALAVTCALAACASSVPDSNPYAGSGVGFGAYDGYSSDRARRDVQLEARRISRESTATTTTTAMAGAAASEEQTIASDTIGVLNRTRPASEAPIAPTAPTAPVAVAAAEAPQAAPVAGASDNPNISDEQSFAAVSSRETIQSDAERLARQRETYQVVQPEAVPQRPGGGGPNIVAYALSTTNRVGEQLYRRSGSVSQSSFQRACSRYGSSDQAQEAFLDAGGPKRDNKGLDPDGDGFACYWDPTPFRAARGG